MFHQPRRLHNLAILQSCRARLARLSVFPFVPIFTSAALLNAWRSLTRRDGRLGSQDGDLIPVQTTIAFRATQAKHTFPGRLKTPQWSVRNRDNSELAMRCLRTRASLMRSQRSLRDITSITKAQHRHEPEIVGRRLLSANIDDG